MSDDMESATMCIICGATASRRDSIQPYAMDKDERQGYGTQIRFKGPKGWYEATEGWVCPRCLKRRGITVRDSVKYNGDARKKKYPPGWRPKRRHPPPRKGGRKGT